MALTKTKYFKIPGIGSKLFVGPNEPSARQSSIYDLWLDSTNCAMKLYNGVNWLAAAINNGSISTAKLANDILSADAAGRAKMANGFVITALLAAGVLSADADGRALIESGFFDASTILDKVADGAIDPRKLVVPAVDTDNTADALAITAAMVLDGILERDPNGGNRTDTLPSAADLVAAITAPFVGQTIDFYVINTANGAESITVNAGTDGTMKPAAPAAISQNQARQFKFILTNVTAASEAYDVYAITG